MTVELSRQASTECNNINPLINDIRCRTLALSLGEPPVDEAAADEKKQLREEEARLQLSPTLTTICDSPRSVFISSAQLDAYHPIEDKIYLNVPEKLYAIFDGHGGGIFFILFFIVLCVVLWWTQY